MSPGLRLYLDFVVFLFGAVIGSFLNVCVHRMPRGQSIVSPRSHCPHCDQPIGWRDNIPLLSYLVLGGRCRHCRARITPRYFLVELLTATLFLSVVLTFGWQWVVPIYWVLLAGLLAATFIDFEHYIIPNELTYGGVLLGFLFSVLVPGLQHTPSRASAALDSFLGFLVGGLTLFLVAEFGKLAFGRRKVRLSPGAVVRIENNTLIVGEEQMTWEEIFSRSSDRIRFRAATLKFQDLPAKDSQEDKADAGPEMREPAIGAEPEQPATDSQAGQVFENVEVSISETSIEVNGTSYPLAETGPMEATTDLLIIPREAMGLGDAKLLAAIGAFLGWQATLFSVFASSALGGVVSVVLILARLKNWQSRIPYGPYIAAGAVIWIFWGWNLVDWYINWIKGTG